jgi:hypothetical protein
MYKESGDLGIGSSGDLKAPRKITNNDPMTRASRWPNPFGASVPLWQSMRYPLAKNLLDPQGYSLYGEVKLGRIKPAQGSLASLVVKLSKRSNFEPAMSIYLVSPSLILQE